MTRTELMLAADRLDEAKREFRDATGTDREDLREEIQDLQRQLMIGGYEEPGE